LLCRLYVFAILLSPLLCSSHRFPSPYNAANIYYILSFKIPISYNSWVIVACCFSYSNIADHFIQTNSVFFLQRISQSTLNCCINHWKQYLTLILGAKYFIPDIGKWRNATNLLKTLIFVVSTNVTCYNPNNLSLKFGCYFKLNCPSSLFGPFIIL